MTRYLSVFLFLVFLSSGLTAQVGINTSTPDASAALDVTATDKGLLIPRVALASAIPSPVAGLMVHQTTAPAGFYYHNGTGWTLIGGPDNLGNHTATTDLNMASKDVKAVDSLVTNNAKIGANNYPTTTGTNEQVLQTDGAGALSWATIGGLPTQTGQSGKFLTTNGTNASWANVPGVRVELIATKTDATQQPARAQGSNTGDIITFNNVVTAPTLGTYSSNTYMVGTGQGGLYYIQVRSVSVDNATPTSTTGHWFKIEIDPAGATTPSFINDRDIYGPFPVLASSANFPTGLRGRSEISAVVQLNAGDSFVIKGLTAQSAVDNSIKNDGSCKLTILKLN